MNHLQPHSVAAVSTDDHVALLSGARALKRAALAGSPQKPLRGKNIGLLCEAQDAADAELFRRAATELGARVARISPTASGLLAPDGVPRTARILSRLYDAIECQGLPADLVQQLRVAAGVPVCDAIGSQSHPSAALAAMLEGGVDDADNRRFILQAMLIATLR